MLCVKRRSEQVLQQEWNCCCTFSSRSAPGEATAPGWHSCPSPHRGRTDGVPGCLGFLMGQSLGVSQWERLSCPHQEKGLREEATTGSGTLLGITIPHHHIPCDRELLRGDTRASGRRGGEPHRVEEESSAHLFKVKNRQDSACRRQFVLSCC